MLKRFGSIWGGWDIDISLVNDGDLILSGGIANDTSFEQSLYKVKKCKFIGVDPNQSSKAHCEGLTFKNDYIFIKAGLSNKSGRYKTYDGIKCESIGIQELINKNDFSLIKMDIEGGEYECIESVSNWRNVKQVAVEFHHWVPAYNKTIEMTYSAINKLKLDGFKCVFHQVNVPERKIQECLFIKEDLTSLSEILFN